MGKRENKKKDGENRFDVNRMNYKRLEIVKENEELGIKIKEGYKDIIYKDIKKKKKLDILGEIGLGGGKRRKGKKIRKVYIWREK